MASTSITFDAAVSYVAGTSSLPMSNDTKLEFYGLYKQATEVGGRSKKGGSSRAETPGVLFFHPCVDTPHLHPPLLAHSPSRVRGQPGPLQGLRAICISGCRASKVVGHYALL